MRVNSVSGTTVRLMAPLYDSYNLGAVNLYRLDGASTVFEDFTVLAPSLEVVGVAMRMIDRPIMRNVWCTGALGASLEFERCTDVQFYGAAFQSQIPTNDEYGVCLANVHGGSIIAPSLNAGRHGLAIGGYDVIGGVTNRGVTVQVALMGNNAPTGAQDMHGNAEDIRFYGGTFSNGGVLAGKNIKWFGCTFKGRQNAGGIALYSGEPCGGSFEFIGCTFESLTNPGAQGYGTVDLGNLTDATRSACRFIFEGCTYRAPNTTRYLISVGIAGALFPPSVIIRGAYLDAPGLLQFLRLNRSSGVATMSRVVATDIYDLPQNAEYVTNAGGGLTVTRYTLPRQYGTVTVAGVTTSNNAQALITFNHPYPVSPFCMASKSGGAVIGGATFVPDVQTTTAGGILVNATTLNGANYPNTSTGTIGWEAIIDQH